MLSLKVLTGASPVSVEMIGLRSVRLRRSKLTVIRVPPPLLNAEVYESARINDGVAQVAEIKKLKKEMPMRLCRRNNGHEDNGRLPEDLRE